MRIRFRFRSTTNTGNFSEYQEKERTTSEKHYATINTFSADSVRSISAAQAKARPTPKEVTREFVNTYLIPSSIPDELKARWGINKNSTTFNEIIRELYLIADPD